MPTDQEKATMAAWQQLLIAAATKEGLPNPLPRYGADGLGGTETQAAIEDFQKRHGLPITGQLDAATEAALNPKQSVQTINPSVAEFAVETAVELALPQSPIKDLIMAGIPTVVTQLLGWLPGVPDDFAVVMAEVKEQASSDPEVAKIRSAAIFAQRLADACNQVANTIDPTGKIQPSVPIPPAYTGATAPSTATAPTT